MVSMERLYRSRREKMLGGVCGGLAEYFKADVLLVRLLAIVALFSGIGVLAYLIAWIIIPVNPFQDNGAIYRSADADAVYRGTASDAAYKDPARSKERKMIGGIILVVLGLLFLMDSWLPHWFSFGKMWPVLLVLVGAAILLRGDRK